MHDRQQMAAILSRWFGEADGLSAALDERLAFYAARSRQVLPEVMAAYDRLVQHLEAVGAGRGAPSPGDDLPPFALPDSAGRLVRLDALLETGLVIVSLNRGHWCPYCRLELRALARVAPRLAQRRAHVVSIVPEPAELTGLLAERESLPFRVLSDMDLAYTSALNLAIAVNAEVVAIYRELGIDLPRFQARDGWLLPIPATYVVGSDRKIRAAFVDPEFRKRMTIEQLEAALDD